MRIIAISIVSVTLASAAAAQTDAAIDTTFSAESVLVIMPISDDNAVSDTETLLGELSLKGQAETVLDNGVRLRARTTLRLQKDHPDRVGYSGGFGTLPGAPVGAFSGLSAAPTRSSDDPRVRLETAYLQVDGGYGEVRVGKDLGVAARFHEGSKAILTHARLDSALLDPTGLATVRTRHDLTGPSLKLSYASPRILGLRAGISYTPDATADGLDRRPHAGTGGTGPDISDAIELALNGTRRFRDSGLRIDAALAWSTASVGDRGAVIPYRQVETFSAGTRLEQDDWTLGAAWLASDNGLANGDYSAWSAGIARRAYEIDWSLDYGEASDDAALIESSGWRLGAARSFGKEARIAIAYLSDKVVNSQNRYRSQGVVVEITLSSEILKLTGN